MKKLNAVSSRESKMTHRGAVAFTCTAIAASALCAFSLISNKTAVDRPTSILAYYEGTGSKEALTTFHANINQLSTDTYDIDRSGHLSGSIPDDAIGFANSHGIASYLAISNWENKDFSPAIADAFLRNPAAQARTIEILLRVLSMHKYAGVNMDFESIPARDRIAYTSFLAELSKRLHASGLKLIVSVPAEQADNPSDSWTGAFDYRAIGESSDLVQLMAYDQHGPWGSPGPVAGNNWVLGTVRFASQVIPIHKLSLGLPAYGYDWNLTAGTGVQIHWNQIPDLLSRTGAIPARDPESKAPHLSYTAPDGAKHEVWYEDAESISLKASYAVTYHLAGVNEFALGFDNQSFWDAVHKGLTSG